MKSKFRLTLAGMLILVLLLAISTDVLAAKYKIAVVLKALNSDYWKSVAAGVKDAAEKNNVDVSIVGPSDETQVMQQINLLQDQITRGIDALVVAPLRPSASIPIFEQAYKQNIPVITIDTDADWDKRVCFVGTGNYQATKKAGKYIAEKTNGKGKVAIIRGAMGDYIYEERTRGFLDGIEGSQLEIITNQPADSKRGKALSVMQNILQAYSDINVVYGENDEMALGALRAIKSSNLNHEVIIMGFDGSPDAIKSILNDGMTATIKQDSYGIGYTGVEMAVKYLNGDKISKEVPVPTIIIDRDNVKESIKDLKKSFSLKRLKTIFGNEVIDEIFQ